MTTMISGRRLALFLGGSGLLGMLMGAAACSSSSSSGGKAVGGNDASSSDAPMGDATADDGASADATAGDSGGYIGCGSQNPLSNSQCDASVDPAVALAMNGPCPGGGALVTTCGGYFDMAWGGLDTSSNCYYDRTTGALVGNVTNVSACERTFGDAPDCGTWTWVPCVSADAAPPTDGAPTD